ncbi:MAG: hypothetical protein LUG18_00445 [Candidatus Azobacteroides sp.]|nr:hypothetical protein [Candidatus Azobacteroides sp.]
MKKGSFLLIGWLLGFFLMAQEPYFPYEIISGEEAECAFPVFTSSSAVTEKINRTLQISELELLKGYEKEHIFEVVGNRDLPSIYGNIVTMIPLICDNGERYLSIKFDKTSCGMTCVYGVVYYNFNPGNGDIFQLSDLFTEKGFPVFSSYVLEKRKKDLQDSVFNETGQHNAEGFESVLENYENDILDDFYLRNDTLFIDGENSFHKNLKFSGINTISYFVLNEFKEYLNDYGKAIFGISGENPGKYRSVSLPQLFTGKIAGKEVLMMLKNMYDNEMKGEYVYTDYGKGIYLTGKRTGNLLMMTEKDGFEDNGFIEANMEGNRISGKWINKDRTKTYPLLLERK